MPALSTPSCRGKGRINEAGNSTRTLVRWSRHPIDAGTAARGRHEISSSSQRFRDLMMDRPIRTARSTSRAKQRADAGSPLLLGSLDPIIGIRPSATYRGRLNEWADWVSDPAGRWIASPPTHGRGPHAHMGSEVDPPSPGATRVRPAGSSCCG